MIILQSLSASSIKLLAMNLCFIYEIKSSYFGSVNKEVDFFKLKLSLFLNIFLIVSRDAKN